MSVLGGLLYQPETSSSVLTEIVNKTTTNVLMSSMTNSSQSNTATNTLNVSDITAAEGCSLVIAGNQTIIQTPNLTSVTEESQASALDTAIKDALTNSLKETSRGMQLLSIPSNTEVINKHINDISSNVSKMSVVNCVQTNVSTNEKIITSIQTSCPNVCRRDIDFSQWSPDQMDAYDKICSSPIGGGNQDIVQAAVASCISKNSQVTQSINELSAILVTSSEKETVGIDPEGIINSVGDAVSGILESGQIIFIIIGIIILILLIMYVYSMFRGKTELPIQMQQPPIQMQQPPYQQPFQQMYQQPFQQMYQQPYQQPY
jgi:cobalamin biosynthesis Mg chelatase CobN